MPDLTVDPAVRGSQEWEVVIPGNITAFTVLVPYEPTEWSPTPHRLLIEVIDGTGLALGSSDNTNIAIDRTTGLPKPFALEVVQGLEPDANFPPGRRKGRLYIIDGERFRQPLIDSPITVRITVDASITYGVNVDTHDRDVRAAGAGAGA